VPGFHPPHTQTVQNIPFADPGFTSHVHIAPLDERVTARLAELRGATGREPTRPRSGAPTRRPWPQPWT
jgi:hypothetical protein